MVRGMRLVAWLLVVTLCALAAALAGYRQFPEGVRPLLTGALAIGLAVAAPVLLVALAIDAAWFLLWRARPRPHPLRMRVTLLIAVVVIVALEIRTVGLVARGLQFRSRAEYLRSHERALRDEIGLFDQVLRDLREESLKPPQEASQAVLEFMADTERKAENLHREKRAWFSAWVTLRKHYESATWHPWRCPAPVKPVEEEVDDIVNSRLSVE